MKDCSQCGKSVRIYNRVFNGMGYCTACYNREFKHKPCAKCGEIYRLPHREKDVVCDKCQKNRPCLRCGKEHYSIGKLTQYGPVCNACAVYFREKKICSVCKKQSFGATRLGKSGTGAWFCPSCYGKARGHASCPKCGRHRMLQKTEHGAMCKKCATEGHTNCTICHAEIPAGKGKKCDNCAWAERLAHRINLLKVSVRKGAVRDAFPVFALWLAQDVGNDKAAMTIERYAPFFRVAAQQWPTLPDFPTILSHFKPKGMRRYLKVKQWLEQLPNQKTDKTLAVNLAEQDRIKVLRGKLAGNPVAESLFDSYHDKLLSKYHAGKTSITSIRLAMQPVIGLMQGFNHFPIQEDIDAYLRKKPGQRAALTGFISYLRREYALDLHISKVTKKDQQRMKVAKRNTLEKKVIAYIMRCYKDPDAFRLHDWLRLALPYFHWREIRSEYTVIERPDGYMVSQLGEEMFVPVLNGEFSFMKKDGADVD